MITPIRIVTCVLAGIILSVMTGLLPACSSSSGTVMFEARCTTSVGGATWVRRTWRADSTRGPRSEYRARWISLPCGSRLEVSAGSGATFVRDTTIRAGFPFACMRGTTRGGTKTIGRRSTIDVAGRSIPIVPIPAGMIANTALLATAFLVATAVRERTRRRRRLRQGACPACGYDVTASGATSCAECGALVSGATRPLAPMIRPPAVIGLFGLSWSLSRFIEVLLGAHRFGASLFRDDSPVFFATVGAVLCALLLAAWFAEQRRLARRPVTQWTLALLLWTPYTGFMILLDALEIASPTGIVY